MGWRRSILTVSALVLSLAPLAEALDVVLQFDGPSWVSVAPGETEVFEAQCIASVRGASDTSAELCGYSLAFSVSGADLIDISATRASYLFESAGFAWAGEIVETDGEVGGVISVTLSEGCVPILPRDRLPVASMRLGAQAAKSPRRVSLRYLQEIESPGGGLAGRTELLLDGESVVPFAESLAIPVGTGAPFLRGDSNADGRNDIADSTFTFNALFLGTSTLGCLDAADTNDDGRVDIADGIATLQYNFLGGAPPALPFPECGPDFTADAHDCASYPVCGSVTIAWDPPTTNQDGTALRDLAGYKLRYGPRSGHHPDTVDVGNTTSHRFGARTGGPLYVVIVAYDVAGNESAPSSEVVVDFER